MTPLSTITAIITLGLGLLAIHAAARAVIRFFIDFDPKTEALVKPFYKEEYFCKNGHSFGTEKPPVGRLCDQCIAEGSTAATCETCEKEGLAQKTIYVDKTPPYRFQCQRHGIITPDTFTMGGRRVTYDEWVKDHTVDEPKPVFVPGDYRPRSRPIRGDQKPRIEQALARLEELEKAVDITEKARDRRVPALEERMRQRQREYRKSWLPGSVLLSLLSILFVYAYAFSNVRITLSLDRAIDTTAWVTTSMLQLLAIILLVYLFLRFAFRKIKPKDTKGKINKEVVMFLVASFISVVILPLIFGEPITLMDIFQGFAFDIIAETTAVLLISINLFKVLERARDKFKELDFDAIRKMLNEYRPALLMQFDTSTLV